MTALQLFNQTIGSFEHLLVETVGGANVKAEDERTSTSQPDEDSDADDVFVVRHEIIDG